MSNGTSGGNIVEEPLTIDEMHELALHQLRQGNTEFCLPWEESLDEAIQRVEQEMADEEISRMALGVVLED